MAETLITLTDQTVKKGKASSEVTLTKSSSPMPKQTHKSGSKASSKSKFPATPEVSEMPSIPITPEVEVTPEPSGPGKKVAVREQQTVVLPNGWTIRAVKRQTGQSMGKFDVYYFR